MTEMCVHCGRLKKAQRGEFFNPDKHCGCSPAIQPGPQAKRFPLCDQLLGSDHVMLNWDSVLERLEKILESATVVTGNVGDDGDIRGWYPDVPGVRKPEQWDKKARVILIEPTKDTPEILLKEWLNLVRRAEDGSISTVGVSERHTALKKRAEAYFKR